MWPISGSSRTTPWLKTYQTARIWARQSELVYRPGPKSPRKFGNPAKNPGVAAEKQVAILDGGTYYPLGGNPTTNFGKYVIRKMQSAWNGFMDAYGTAPEPKEINVDENGNFLGNIDYPPYN